MNDWVRKSDALAAAKGFIGAETAIAALPAVTVGVQEAVIHRAVLDWVKDDTGAAIKMTITPDQANALTARILAALEPVAAPDPAAIREAALREAAQPEPICRAEQEFMERFKRRIDIGGKFICSGGKERCEDCRCNLDKNWRKSK